MKRVCLILFGALAVFPACDKPLDENQEEGFNGKSIVVYFSNPLPALSAWKSRCRGWSISMLH